MNIQSIVAFGFILGMFLFVWWNKKNIEVKKILFPLLYFVMYRGSWGITSMDRIAARFPRTLRVIAKMGIFFGILGMLFISYQLMYGTYQLFTMPEAPQTIQPVLPFQVKGAAYVPFDYLIPAIFLIAIVHEFSHGVMARLYKLNVKSSGFAFLGIVVPVIPAAFVEPDEKKLFTRPVSEQLAIFAAGPFANILFAALLLVLIFSLINPLSARMLDFTGVTVTTVVEGAPAAIAGLTAGERILAIDQQQITTTSNFTSYLQTIVPGTTLTILTNKTEHTLVTKANEKNASKAYLGVNIAQHLTPNPAFVNTYGSTTVSLLQWFFGLLYWLLVLNLGIGTFNLVPIGPIDGGRMLYLILTTYLKKERGKRIFHYISVLLLALILVNIFVGMVLR